MGRSWHRIASTDQSPHSHSTVTAQSQHIHSTVTDGELSSASDRKHQSASNTHGHQVEYGWRACGGWLLGVVARGRLLGAVARGTKHGHQEEYGRRAWDTAELGRVQNNETMLKLPHSSPVTRSTFFSARVWMLATSLPAPGSEIASERCFRPVMTSRQTLAVEWVWVRVTCTGKGSWVLSRSTAERAGAGRSARESVCVEGSPATDLVLERLRSELKHWRQRHRVDAELPEHLNAQIWHRDIADDTEYSIGITLTV